MSTTVLDITTDNIRAALGLSEVELKDERITNLMIADQLTVNLAEVYPEYDTLKAAINPGPGTADQQKTWIIVKLYEMYKAAVLMLPEAQLLFAQIMMDGETSMTRFQNDNLADTIDRITGQADLYAGMLNPDYAASSGLGFKIFNTVSPTYDPVTGYPNVWSMPAILADLAYLGIRAPVFV